MSWLQIYQWVCQWKNFENRLTFGEVMGKSLVSCFFWDTVYMSEDWYVHSEWTGAYSKLPHHLGVRVPPNIWFEPTRVSAANGISIGSPDFVWSQLWLTDRHTDHGTSVTTAASLHPVRAMPPNIMYNTQKTVCSQIPSSGQHYWDVIMSIHLCVHYVADNEFYEGEWRGYAAVFSV